MLEPEQCRSIMSKQMAAFNVLGISDCRVISARMSQVVFSPASPLHTQDITGEGAKYQYHRPEEFFFVQIWNAMTEIKLKYLQKKELHQSRVFIDRIGPADQLGL